MSQCTRVADLTETTDHEWAEAANLRGQYWPYVLDDCHSTNPMLKCVQDPFAKLLVRAKGGMMVDEASVLEAAESEGPAPASNAAQRG